MNMFLLLMTLLLYVGLETIAGMHVHAALSKTFSHEDLSTFQFSGVNASQISLQNIAVSDCPAVQTVPFDCSDVVVLSERQHLCHGIIRSHFPCRMISGFGIDFRAEAMKLIDDESIQMSDLSLIKDTLGKLECLINPMSLNVKVAFIEYFLSFSTPIEKETFVFQTKSVFTHLNNATFKRGKDKAFFKIEYEHCSRSAMEAISSFYHIPDTILCSISGMLAKLNNTLNFSILYVYQLFVISEFFKEEKAKGNLVSASYQRFFQIADQAKIRLFSNSTYYVDGMPTRVYFDTLLDDFNLGGALAPKEYLTYIFSKSPFDLKPLEIQRQEGVNNSVDRYLHSDDPKCAEKIRKEREQKLLAISTFQNDLKGGWKIY